MENIAFRMMQENTTIISLENTKYLKYLSHYRELYIKNEQVSFSHKALYEVFAAKYIFRHIYKEEKEPQEFSRDLWNFFANNLCSMNILNHLKNLVKNEKINNNSLNNLNYNFSYMLERGMISESHNCIDIYKEISNVFYMIWHIVSHANRIFYGFFKPNISKKGETNLFCLINVFNKIYFNNKFLDFSYTDLSNLKLCRCNLININFKKSKLNHINFLGSHMDGSDFQQADLSYSNLDASDLRCANLRDIILTGANVGNCMISEDSLKYFLPYKDTLLHIDKLIVFMNDGTIKYPFK